MTHPISWNNAACILVNGQLIAMVEEERLNRIKHAPRMPATLALQYCLKEADITLDQVDFVAVGFDSAIKAALGNLQKDNLVSGLNQAAMWFVDGLTYERKLPLKGYPSERVHFINHHLAHSASTFFASGFNEANILSLDGSGGTESGILAFGKGTDIKILRSISNRSSWGLMYEQITEKLGFRRHSGEGKVMGLASYGVPDPRGLPCIRWDDEIPTIDPQLRKSFINSIKARHKDDPILADHKNLAATLQDSLERAGIIMAKWLYEKTRVRNLCLAGGTALNCSMNGKLALLPFIDNIYVQPAAHDSGTALGAALYLFVTISGTRPRWKMEHAYWGPEYDNSEIEEALKAFPDLNYHKSDDIFSETAQLLALGKIVGWFQGRSEIGPRALGNRSILADPSRPDMKDRINNQVKHREPWRPFAPSILEEKINRYIAYQKNSPFMILAFDTLQEHRAEIISAAHVDGTIRPQTVSQATNPRYWHLIKSFEKITGIPAILNTSFNVDSQPIVNTPQEAIDTFINCGVEILAIGDFIVSKPE
jgi:carbamoyltransferase